MDFLKDLFNGGALTYEDFSKAAGAAGLALADVSEGKGWVKAGDLAAKDAELAAAHGSLKELGEKIKKFDGVDVEKLKGDVAAWEDKYNKDIASVRKEAALDMAIMQAKGRNPKAIKALLDMDGITVAEDGTLKGLDLEALKKSDAYLFEPEEKQFAGPGFAKGGNDNAIESVNSEIASAMGIK